MLLPEFVQAFREAVKDRTQTGWSVLLGCEFTGCIRLYKDHGSIEECFCPLTLVAHQLTGTERNISQFHQAGGDLGLSPQLTGDIAAAADGNGSLFPGNDARYAIRRALLEALASLDIHPQVRQ